MPRFGADEANVDVLTRRLMELPAWRTLYLQTLIEASRLIADPGVSGDSRGWLEQEADRLEALVGPAAAADPVSPFSYEAFKGNIDDLRLLLRTRPARVIADATAALGG